MSKVVALTCGILMFSSIAFADDVNVETCADGVGTVIVGAVTGHKYCKGKRMDWWNANAWCDAQGRRLFSLSDCGCSDLTANCAGNICADLLGVSEKWAWTSSHSDSSNAYQVDLSSGKMRVMGHNYMSTYDYSFVLCY
ncbi:MAG: hypothetical protein IKV03_00125 [Alphaproteobacteria bacterium]|nr:hypothetical protein [Alphaproteobacteria bacterium]